MDKKQLMAGTLAALTVVGTTPAAFAAQTDNPIPYAVMSTKSLEEAGITLFSQDDESGEIAPLASTLQDQITAATSGVETRITLQGDVSEDLTIPADKKIVLDLGGFKLTNVSGHTITNNGTLTIEGTGTVDNLTHQKAAIYNDVGGIVILNGGTYTRSQEKGADANNSGGNSYYNIFNWGEMTINAGAEVKSNGHYSSLIENGFFDGTKKTTNPKLTINGGTFSGGLNTVKNDDRGVLEIKNGTFTNVSQAAVLNWNEATIDGGEFKANDGALAVVLNGHINDGMDQGKLTINGGSFTAAGNAPVIKEMTVSGADAIGTVEINAGTFTTDSGEIIHLETANEGKAQINIISGSFSTSNTESKAKLEQYVDPSSNFDADSGTVSALPAEQAAASVGAKNYKSLADAINAAPDNVQTTITLRNACQEDVVIPAGKNIVLDLNGQTLSNSKDHTITNNGTLTIQGDGTIDCTTHARGAVNNNGTLTISGGTLTRSVDVPKTNSWYVVNNAKGATMTIDGGEIIGNSTYSSCVRNLGNATVSGGTIRQDKMIAFKNDDTGVLTVTGGKIISEDQAIQNWKTAEVKGGEIEGRIYTWGYVEKGQKYAGETTISGGKVTGDVAAVNYDGQTAKPDVKITGDAEIIGSLKTCNYDGGKFTDKNNDDGSKLTVSGGSFSQTVNKDHLDSTLKAELNTGKGDVPYSYYPTVNEAKEAAKKAGGGTVTDLTTPTTKTYTVTLKFDDGATADQTLTVAENGTVILPAPTRSGYAFQNWSDGTTTYTAGSEYTVTKEAALTATWKKTAFTVTLDYANNGETATENRGANDGDTITLPTPTRSGRYAFVHWTDGTNTYAGGTNYTVTKDATLTAVWRYIGSSSSGTTSSYPVSVPRFDNGSVSVTPGAASKGTTVTITVKPNDGYELSKLTVTDQSGNRLSLNDQGNNKYTFTMPSGKVNVDAAFSKIETTMNFWDVKQGDYYYDAVKWAVEKRITEGTGANFFSPNASCTRAQMVTFLWRAAGSPAPKSTANPFTDVSANDYFYNAVLWAVENGITTGAGADRFAPGATVSRAQTVTFLYRANGSPAASGASFSDVAADEYYANAVAWAVQNGITTGTGNGKFSPNADCTRGQIVTLLYRADTK